jgi:hypothetical protein
MDDIDISRDACEDHADYCRGYGPSTTPDLILALRAALDRDKASGWKAIAVRTISTWTALTWIKCSPPFARRPSHRKESLHSLD